MTRYEARLYNLKAGDPAKFKAAEKSGGLSLEEIKNSGYLVNPDPVFGVEGELVSPEFKKINYDKLKRIKEYYKDVKNPMQKKLLDEALKEQELEMFKSGLLRIG